MHLRTTLPLVFLASLACLHPTAAAATTTQACNGDATFCVRKYSQVTYVTTHNSYAYQSGNVAANQRYDIVTQLNDGVRGFMLDAHYKLDTNPNGIQLCHASCSLLDSGDLLTTLQQMNQWLLVNPTEVVTIFWENFDNIPAATFNTAYLQSGIMNIVYTQPAATLDWPTLGDLVKQNKRVINFIDRGADAAVPWLHNEYTYVFETPFSNLNQASFSNCVADRPKNPSNPTQMPYVMNHFLDGNLTIGSIVIETPQPGQAAVTNGQSLADEAVLCKKNFQHNPTFLAVDFYDQGNAFQVAAVLNGITYVAKPLTGSTASGAAQPSKTGSSNPVSGISISFGSAAQVRPKSWGAVVVAGVVGVGAVWGLM